MQTPYTPELLAKARETALFILDVDGVLTTGQLAIQTDGSESFKTFHVLDGLGLKLIQSLGIAVAVISGRESSIVTHRLQALGVTAIWQNVQNKQQALDAILTHFSIPKAATAYIGDDLPDLAVFKQVGLAISVPNAPLYIQEQADFVTKQAGGQGAVRECCDLFGYAHNAIGYWLESFTQHGRLINTQGVPETNVQ